MPTFSPTSQARLNTCHPDIIKVFNAVVAVTDCTVIEGERTIETQREYFRTGKSKLDPDNPDLLAKAMHCKSPSLAIDVMPYPIDWQDKERIACYAGFVLGTANQLGIKLRWGGNWDRDLTVLNATAGFFDGPHYELIE